MDARKGARSREPEFDTNRDVFYGTTAFVMKEEPSFQDLCKRRSNLKQFLILLASGLVLSAGSCAGFLDTANINSAIAVVFAIAFFAGVILTIGALVWGLI